MERRVAKQYGFDFLGLGILQKNNLRRRTRKMVNMNEVNRLRMEERADRTNLNGFSL